MNVRDALACTIAGQSLSEADMESVLGLIMAGDASPAQIAGLLVALRMKGETVEEICGGARALRARANCIAPRAQVVDTCGTGGDQAGTFNISTAAALIAAGAGLKVAKHGNRAMSGTVGGADVLEALGVRIDLPPERVAACIDEVGMGFLFAQAFHPAMRHAAAPRRELGIRTIFNLLGPLSNPAGAQRQLVGVFARQWTEPLAEALGRLGCVHALVVHGDDGLDEISLAAATQVAEFRDGALRAYRVTPEEFGLSRCRPEDLQGGDRERSAQIIRDILDGGEGPRRDIAVLNAGAALYVGGLARSISEGIGGAQEAVRTGQARRTLQKLVEFTNQ